MSVKRDFTLFVSDLRVVLLCVQGYIRVGESVLSLPSCSNGEAQLCAIGSSISDSRVSLWIIPRQRGAYIVVVGSSDMQSLVKS